MNMKWKSVEAWFESIWFGKDSYCFQFHDSRAAMGVTGSKRVFTTEHPSDFLVTNRGETFYAEVKSSQEKVSFPFSNVKKSQWKAAAQVTAAGGKYFFFIYSHAMECWYKIDGQQMLDFKRIKESVRWTDLNDFIWHPTK